MRTINHAIDEAQRLDLLRSLSAALAASLVFGVAFELSEGNGREKKANALRISVFLHCVCHWRGVMKARAGNCCAGLCHATGE